MKIWALDPQYCYGYCYEYYVETRYFGSRCSRFNTLNRQAQVGWFLLKTLLDHPSMVAVVAMVAKIQMTQCLKILIGRILSPVCVIGLQGLYLVDQEESNLIM